MDNNNYLELFRGYFKGVPKWHDLDALWGNLRNTEHNEWYIYAVGETPPTEALPKEKLLTFIDEIDKLLHTEHHEDYCGIVYADDTEQPSFVKIYDPHNLGSACGSGSLPPPLPGWVLSTIQPEDLQHAFPQTGSRKRWWNSIFG
ncbi:MAG: hypothetical protein OQK25_01880 [Gammaproteobacteria bacterium]|nr:hypothetical protein [Gammaproteobacteria bacterium]